MQFHSFYITGAHKHFPLKALPQWWSLALPHSAFSHKKLINTKVTDSQQIAPLQRLWKVLVLMVGMRHRGEKKQH